MPNGKPTSLLLATLAASLALALAAPVALAAPANYEGISADGKVAFFATTDKMVPGDTDSRRDVYMRSFDSVVPFYVTREISTGPSGGNDAFDSFFNRASGDGTQVFFTTDERLVGVDTDQARDVYLRDLSESVTVLVSQGECAPGCGNGAADAGFADASADGSAAFFSTDEKLTAADTDGAADIYRRDLEAGTTTLVSAGAASCAQLGCGNGEETATMRGLSADGSAAFFATPEQLAGSDTDIAIDIYARELPSGPTTHVSQGDAGCPLGCGNDDSADVVFAGSSHDGDIAFFETAEGLVPGDGDGGNDVYRRAAGTTTLISGGTQAQPANFAAASTTGSRVFFTTVESLNIGDANSAADVYLWEGGVSSLVTPGKACCGSEFEAATADGTKVVFTTTDKLVEADADAGAADVYAQEIGGGGPALASRGAASCEPGCGSSATPAIFNGAAAGASRIFFSSVEAMTADDGDSNADIFVRDLEGSSTTLVSAEGVFCPTTPGGCDAIFRAASVDGTRAFFQTTERLTEGDGDPELDVYEREGTQTRLVSAKNSVELELGPSTPELTGTNPTSPGDSMTPAIVGQADLETSIKLYTTPDCSGEVVATGTAAQLGGTGIVTTVAAGSTTSFRVTATDGSGDTSECSNAVTYKQESAPPPPLPPGGGGSGGSGSGGGSGDSGKGGGKSGGKPGAVYVTPHTRITFAPAGKTLARRPVFRFTDATGQQGTSFRCKVDRGRWRGCGSPIKLKMLKIGRHVFQVKAVNAVGETEPAPQKRRFKVVTG
jgi:Tol biopolymer transport system component